MKTIVETRFPVEKIIIENHHLKNHQLKNKGLIFHHNLKTVRKVSKENSVKKENGDLIKLYVIVTEAFVEEFC